MRTIGQARANFSMGMMAAAHNIQRLTFLELGSRQEVVCP